MINFKHSHYYILVLVVLISGCATTGQVPVNEQIKENIELKEVSKKVVVDEVKVITGVSENTTQINNIDDEQIEDYVEKKGVVFAKTDFQGMLKTSYVKIVFENLEGEVKQYQLHVGDKTNQKVFPWDVETVKPGYFFIELPVGKYKLVSVSIPVASTMATEEADINFEVLGDSIIYLGTLKMVGTKDRIKLGGVPVIKPGFDYTVEIIDEYDEGQKVFKEQYPEVTSDILKMLMQVPEKN